VKGPNFIASNFPGKDVSGRAIVEDSPGDMNEIGNSAAKISVPETSRIL